MNENTYDLNQIVYLLEAMKIFIMVGIPLIIGILIFDAMGRERTNNLLGVQIQWLARIADLLGDDDDEEDEEEKVVVPDDPSGIALEQPTGRN